MEMCLKTAVLLTALLVVTWPGTRAMSLGSVGPLFPLFGNSGQQETVQCEQQTLQLMCDTCPGHLPLCSLDLDGCSWDCLPAAAAQGTHIFS